MRFLEVSPRLFLGDLEAAENLPAKITHVVTVDPALPQLQNEQVSFLRIPILDDNKDDLLPWVSRAVDFIRRASDDTVEFPEEKEEGYRVTVVLRRASTAIKWGINWHQGLFQSRKMLVLDDVVEGSLMQAWNDERTYDGWQLRYGDRLLSVNGVNATTKEGRTELQTSTTVMLTFWRNRELPPGSVLVHCHAGVSRSAAVILAYWMHHARLSSKAALQRLRRVVPDCQPNPHLLEELDQFRAMDWCVDEGSTNAHKQYHLRQAQKAWGRGGLSDTQETGATPSSPSSHRDRRIKTVEREHSHKQQLTSSIRRSNASPSSEHSGDHPHGHSIDKDDYDREQLDAPEESKNDDASKLEQECVFDASSTCASPLLAEYREDEDDAIIAEGWDTEIRSHNDDTGAPKVIIDYCCKRCRFCLFSDEQVVSHEGQSASCTSIFAQPMNWMGELTGQNGKLTCPCGAKLGAYCWFGLACSCKAWQAPAFQIHRARIDEMHS